MVLYIHSSQTPDLLPLLSSLVTIRKEKKKPDGLNIKKDFGITREIASGKELKKEKILSRNIVFCCCCCCCVLFFFFRNIVIDYELDQI